MRNQNDKIKHFSGDRFKTGYIDESGDTGKRNGGSKCLVLTYICLNEMKKVNKIIKKTKEQLRRTKKGERWLNRAGGEIKFYGCPDKRILIKTLEELAKLKFPIHFIAIYKNGSPINPIVKMQILYDLIAQTFDFNTIPHKIIADKDYFDNKKVAYLVIQDYEEINEGDNANGYKCKIYIADFNVINDSDKLNMLISIKHENSKNDVGLQVVDLISGAIFQEMENNDKDYTEVIMRHTNIQGKIIKLKK